MRDKTPSKKSPSREVLEWIISIIAAVALAVLFNTFVARFIIVKGSSMIPTLHNSERMLVTRYTYRFRMPRRGEVVVTRYPDPGDEDYYVKRVVGLPGDTLEIRDGVLYVNDEAVSEPYIAAPMEKSLPKTVVPEGCIYVLGDNRNDSLDSRHMEVGPLSLDLVLGEVRAVVWPLKDMRTLTDDTGYFSAYES